jgi:hypothetical protein
VTQPSCGLAVTPPKWTRRLPSSMKKSTYNRRSHTVSTVRKSQAMIPEACARRNADQLSSARRGAGSIPCRRRIAQIVFGAILIPSRVLLETATGANRRLWATINCKHCGRAGRYEITVPDNKVRLDAIQALLHESLGRPDQAEAQPAPAIPATVEQVRRLSWDQLTLVFANQFVSEVPAIVNGDGDSLHAGRARRSASHACSQARQTSAHTRQCS